MPVLAVCGHSGSGKTTLLERVIPLLVARGLQVAVVKHDVHAIQLDRPGKDSDRLFVAGADVYLRGGAEQLIRQHCASDTSISDIEALRWRYDIVLVEGFKHSSWPKVWLLDASEATPPPDVVEVLDVYARDIDRVTRFMALLDEQLPRQWRATPVYGGVLIGGASRRMGQPKHLLRAGNVSWIERTVDVLAGAVDRVAIIGSGVVPDPVAACPRLPDVPDAAGPLAGMLSAMRWARGASWLFVACDMPEFTRDAIDWLLTQRIPGARALLPRLTDDRVEPLCAWYDPRLTPALEAIAASGRYGLQSLATRRDVSCPRVPARFAPAWRNANTPAEIDAPL